MKETIADRFPRRLRQRPYRTFPLSVAVRKAFSAVAERWGFPEASARTGKSFPEKVTRLQAVRMKDRLGIRLDGRGHPFGK